MLIKKIKHLNNNPTGSEKAYKGHRGKDLEPLCDFITPKFGVELCQHAIFTRDSLLFVWYNVQALETPNRFISTASFL